MDHYRSTGVAAGGTMRFKIIIHLIKHLSIIFVKQRSELLPLCSFNFRRNSKRRNGPTHSLESFDGAFKEDITVRRGGWIEETKKLRKVREEK